MRAVQLEAAEQVRLLEIPEPKLEPGRVLVKLERLSICGSDMRYYRSPDPDAFPMPPGCPFHECAGTVVESAVDEFSVGDRVVVLTPERTGGVDYLLADPDKLIRVPEEGDLALWVLAQPLGTVLYPCESLNALGKRVVILGQGPIGLSFTQILAAMMPTELIAVDVTDHRLDVARRLGASAAVNPDRDEVYDTVMDRTEGCGADIVVETAGSAETINTAIDLVRFRGTISCFGQPRSESIPFNYRAFSRKEVHLLPTITHARPDSTAGVSMAVELIAKGRIDVSWMVTHRLPFEDTARAFELYANQLDESLKVVIDL